MYALRVVAAWLLAVLLATVLGAVVQTQFNLASLTGMGVEVSLAQRIGATLHDLVNFSPLYGLLVAAAFLPAFTVSGLLARGWPRWRIPLHVGAGLTAIPVALLVINRLLPVNPLSAARGQAGVLALGLCGALAGMVFARLARRRTAEARDRP
jgi:hypothetical protein